MSNAKVLLLGLMLAASLVTVAPSASAHVCGEFTFINCEGDDCADDGDVHVHVNWRGGICYSIPTMEDVLA